MSQFARYFVPVVLAVLTACGGGGGGGGGVGATAPAVPPPVLPPTPVPEVRLTTVALQSDAGDSIGLGKNYVYNKTTANIGVTAEKNRLVVRVTGDETWTGVFQTGGAEQTQLKAGMVANSVRYQDDGDWSRSSHFWSGEGRGCSSSNGWFAIDSVNYSGPILTQVTLRFVRHCDGAPAALRGEIKYYADDASKPPPPVLPVPATLWRPPAEVTAKVGNYAYFESEEGDFVGLGKNYLYDQRSAAMIVSGNAINMIIRIKGNEQWSAELRGMESSSNLEPGYYPGVHGSRFHNPVKGGLSWTGEGRGCRVSHGWYAIDSVTYAGGLISSLDLRFEQHCEGRAAALRGVVHWSDPNLVVRPPVAGNTAVGAWRAPAASLPASGNYFYVQSDPGEALGKGLVELQTDTTAQISASARDNTLAFETHGVHNWSGEFIAKLGQAQFAPGNYPDLAGFPFAAAPTGAMIVRVDSTAPHEPKGWLVIDSISFVGGKLVAVELRFEQLGANRIGNDYGLLRGQLRWRADQPNLFPGPVVPAPAQFWRPAPGVTPSTGNYVYMESDRSDFIGNQASYLYTPLDSLLSVSGDGINALVEVKGDQGWYGNFVAIAGLNQIQPGYYRGQENSVFSNPARGRFSWGGDGRGCNGATSGVVVDQATYEGARLVALHMRFEQHCENDPGALRGEIHWSASDVRMPQGPAPIPATLWRAPAGALPAGGNYLYVHSEPGAAMGNGKVGLMTAQDTTFFVYTSTPISVEAYFGFIAESPVMRKWSGSLQAMVGLKKFQVGYYNRVLRYPFHNRAFGGLDWSADYSGCNDSIGWFAIDKATYVGDTLTALHARFEHYCEAQVLASHGEINWEASPAEMMAARMRPLSTVPGRAGKGLLQEGPMRESGRR